MSNLTKIEKGYQMAQEKYAEAGVETEKALQQLSQVSLSLNCWQGDDVGGFERRGAKLEGGGLLVTGNYPGKARTLEELRLDLDKVYSLLPGRHRLNLHASYGEFGEKSVDRDEIGPEHFQGWIAWAKERNLALDFNPTCFSHPKANSGFTLSSKNQEIRKFWVEHVRRCRAIAAHIGQTLGHFCLHNLWIPDGMKDKPVDRWSPRLLLQESLDSIYEVEYHPSEIKDALESKLFGIGSESFVAGSHEFYLGYALTRGKMVCLDLGHFHPTESLADKISSLLQFFKELLLHISRGVRWDSDHVVILNDDLKALAEEIVRCQALGRVHLALDFFDASLNRVGAWVIGARAMLKALLLALLEPSERLRKAEEEGNYFLRLALLEEMKGLPFGAVWDHYCLKQGVPAGESWLEEVLRYEAEVLDKRK